MNFTYAHNDQTYTITLQPNPDNTYTATIGDQTYTVVATPMPNGGWVLHLDNQKFSAYVAADGSYRFVHVDGETCQLSVPDTRRKGGKATAGGGDLTAQMPGQVLDVLVAEGDAVSSGQPLVVLEAMKMEIRVAAPQDGVVTRLHVAKGDMVDRGQRLIDIAADEV